MPFSLHVHPLASQVEPDQLEGATVVVIDVLRATTVVVEALHAGAAAVVPCQTVEEARRRGAAIGPAARLAGERGGRPIERFALGNSPSEFTPDTVEGCKVVITTTNGTGALLRARQADDVWIAAFTNLSAVATALSSVTTPVHLLCAGTDGQLTEEDLMLAGAIAERLESMLGPSLLAEGEGVHQALDQWRPLQIGAIGEAAARDSHLAAALRGTRGGQNLVALGYAADIDHAARIDLHASVPQFDAAAGQIQLPQTNRP